MIKKIIGLMLLMGTIVSVNAQKKEVKKEIKTEITDSDTPGKMKMRIEKNIDGKVEIIEKEIDKPEGKSMVMVMDDNLDSLIEGNGDGNQKIIIKKRRDGEKNIDITIDEDSDFDWMEEKYDYPSNRKRVYRFDDGMRQFNFEMDRLHDRMSEIPRKLRGSRLYELDDRIFEPGQPATIKSVDVFTNRPETHVLNIRFYAPNEGDVNISVLDLASKVIAKESAKAFKGEYVGQIKLNKGAKGTYFVLISQGEDGVSKKVRVE